MSCERDCNQGRRCPARLSGGQQGCAAAERGTDAHGNGRIGTTPPGPGTFWFAPGVIDGTGDGASRLGAAAHAASPWRRWARVAAAAVLASLALGLASGWVVGLIESGVLP